MEKEQIALQLVLAMLGSKGMQPLVMSDAKEVAEAYNTILKGLQAPPEEKAKGMVEM
jgi:hypothetical protein